MCKCDVTVLLNDGKGLEYTYIYIHIYFLLDLIADLSIVAQLILCKCSLASDSVLWLVFSILIQFDLAMFNKNIFICHTLCIRHV